MELDWNWYFSATAQSMAAIVGIILGAFIISTLIANNVAYYSKLEKPMKNNSLALFSFSIL